MPDSPQCGIPTTAKAIIMIANRVLDVVVLVVLLCRIEVLRFSHGSAHILRTFQKPFNLMKRVMDR